MPSANAVPHAPHATTSYPSTGPPRPRASKDCLNNSSADFPPHTGHRRIASCITSRSTRDSAVTGPRLLPREVPHTLRGPLTQHLGPGDERHNHRIRERINRFPGNSGLGPFVLCGMIIGAEDHIPEGENPGKVLV